MMLDPISVCLSCCGSGQNGSCFIKLRGKVVDVVTKITVPFDWNKIFSF